MARKRFVIELGYGADLHGADMTKAATKAVKDAVSRSCLCGLVEIHNRGDFRGVHVAIEVAVPEPDKVDLAAIEKVVPVGTVSARAVAGGLRTPGICVECFGPESSDIVAAVAALTVYVDDGLPGASQ